MKDQDREERARHYILLILLVCGILMIFVAMADDTPANPNAEFDDWTFWSGVDW